MLLCRGAAPLRKEWQEPGELLSKPGDSRSSVRRPQPDSKTREFESFVITCLNTRFESEDEREAGMSPPETEPKFKPPPEINCSESITLISEENRPEQYHQFERKSALAIRAALGAKRPLLVRGKPGVGKTQLAAAAAKVLKRPLVSRVVDSRTEARDLLWEFDAVMRLAEAQIAAAVEPVVDSQNRRQDDHPGDISQDRRNVIKQLRKRLSVRRFLRPGPLWWAFDWKSALKQARLSGSPVPTLDPAADPENGCVVLIDEIDKADTDVPNGLLEALGSGEFTPLGSRNPSRSPASRRWSSSPRTKNACCRMRSCGAVSCYD